MMKSSDFKGLHHIDSLGQERRNSSALAIDM